MSGHVRISGYLRIYPDIWIYPDKSGNIMGSRSSVLCIIRIILFNILIRIIILLIPDPSMLHGAGIELHAEDQLQSQEARARERIFGRQTLPMVFSYCTWNWNSSRGRQRILQRDRTASSQTSICSVIRTMLCWAAKPSDRMC